VQSMLRRSFRHRLPAVNGPLVHAVGLGALINFMLPEVAQLPMDYWRSTRLLVRVVWALC